jgi:hypothetical protein
LKRARLKKGLGLATISAVCILAGCSVAREQARLTYDPAKVVPNAPRVQRSKRKSGRRITYPQRTD